jgi:hypothetical protein
MSSGHFDAAGRLDAIDIGDVVDDAATAWLWGLCRVGHCIAGF